MGTVIDGGWTHIVGQTWRRKVGNKWEYQQDEETEDEWETRNTTGF